MRFTSRSMCFSIALAGLSSNLAAQKKAASIHPWVEITGEYDSNVFLLTDSRKSDPGNSSADPSGRYANMESASDIIVQPAAGVRLQTTGVGGRQFAVVPQILYQQYLTNAERSHLTAGIEVSQDLPRSSRLRAGLSYTPDYFARNYLTNAVDANDDGNIAPSERRYAPGRYSDLDADVAYRFRIRKAPKGGGVAVRGEASGGYYTRSYDAPLSGRNLSGPTAAIGVDMDLGRAAVALGYGYESMSATRGMEVLILNENAFGRDFNGNGRSRDIAARTTQSVDRSRTDHSGTLALRLNPRGRTDMLLEVEHRVRDFSSDEPFDIAHRGRRDRRNDVRGGVGFRLRRGLRLVGGAKFSSQTTNRGGDPAVASDTDDFTRIRAHVGARITF